MRTFAGICGSLSSLHDLALELQYHAEVQVQVFESLPLYINTDK